MVAGIKYNRNIPNPPNNPSQDVPLMKVNTNAIDTILAIDHVSFNSQDGGTHKQVTFSSENTPPNFTDPQSALYTGTGSASSNAELYYKNQDATFLISCVKAFGNFNQVNTAPVVAVTLNNGYNVVSVSKSGNNQYKVTFTTNAIKGTTPTVICLMDNVVSGSPTVASNLITYNYSANVLEINTNNTDKTRLIYFIVLEA